MLSFNFGPPFGDNEIVKGQLAGLLVGFEVEAVGKQGLQHSSPGLLLLVLGELVKCGRSLLVHLCLNAVALVEYGRRVQTNDLVCCQDQVGVHDQTEKVHALGLRIHWG